MAGRLAGAEGVAEVLAGEVPGFEPGRVPAVPHVVAWNLTRRCNLACAHCYISAGSWHAAAGELTTAEALRILDQVLEVNRSPMLILSGGEPLLRHDLEAIGERASAAGATVVVGTNGTRLSDERIRSLMGAGIKGVAVSVDSLDPRYHDRFRTGGKRVRRGGRERRLAPEDPDPSARLPVVDAAAEDLHTQTPLADTLAAVERCREHGLDVVIQTSLTAANRAEVRTLAAWAADRGAVSFNLYFLVPTGRGSEMKGLPPGENEAVLAELVELERAYRGRMMVRSKCQPQIMRHVLEHAPDSPLARYPTRCPCGVTYARITPEGKVTPCPYSPLVAGDLRTASFGWIWEESPVFGALRRAHLEGELGGKCGRCEYRGVCGGCRARAWAEHGDLLGPDDSCAYEPTGELPLVHPPHGVQYGAAVEAGLKWTEEARARVERIPSFVRGVVTARVEAWARERGRDVVDLALMAEVRSALPVDFSKRLPFFLRDRTDA